MLAIYYIIMQWCTLLGVIYVNIKQVAISFVYNFKQLHCVSHIIVFVN